MSVTFIQYLPDNNRNSCRLSNQTHRSEKANSRTIFQKIQDTRLQQREYFECFLTID